MEKELAERGYIVFQMCRVEVSVMKMNNTEVFQEDLTDSVAIAVSCRSNFVRWSHSWVCREAYSSISC